MDAEQLFTAISRRDPSKRQIKPVSSANFELLDGLEDDSDSEFICDEDDEDDDSGGDESGTEQEDDNDSHSSNSYSAPLEQSESAIDRNLMAQCSPSREKVSGVAPNPDIELEMNSNQLSNDGKAKQIVGSPVKPSHPSLNKPSTVLVCMVCLGDSDDPNDELIECDGCGIVVHEDCYKVVDSIFLSSGASSSSTDAWFCEACLAGVSNPFCELCPNLSGVFKRTDNNRWVHLLCALYTPGVAFNDPENLMDVTLTELPPKYWSLHECTLCEEKFFAWCGVCIECDAGLCRTFFHVTCAHRHGLLSEPITEENAIDPYFAQCRQHTDKSIARRRRQHYLTAMSRLRQRTLIASQKSPNSTMNIFSELDPRLQRKLEQFRSLYEQLRQTREHPYVPTKRVQLFLEHSPVAMRLFVTKAKKLHLPLELTGGSLATDASKVQPSGHPVFAPEFISYFFEREKKIAEILSHIASLQDAHRELHVADASASHSYSSINTQLDVVNGKCDDLRATFFQIITSLQQLVPDIIPTDKLKSALEDANELPDTEDIDLPTSGLNAQKQSRSHVGRVLSARLSAHARTKLSKRFTSPSAHKNIPARSGVVKRTFVDKERVTGNIKSAPEDVIVCCFVCNGLRDQHLITKCDTCSKGFHLACLDPPLLRMPKRSQRYGWQCSYCTKAVASSAEHLHVDVNEPRKLRRSLSRQQTTSEPQVEPALPSTESAVSSDLFLEATVRLVPNVELLPAPDPPPPPHRPDPLENVPPVPEPKNNGRRIRNRFLHQSRVTTRGLNPFRFLQEKVSRGRGGKRSAEPTRGISTAAKRSRSEAPLTTRMDGAGHGQTVFTSESSNSTTHDPGKFDAYEYNAGANSDEELARLRTSKVIKVAQIRDHSQPNYAEAVQQIAPLNMRYIICRDGQKQTPTNRFRMRLKKL